MRVLMISSLWPPTVLGGAELYAADLARHLRDRGVEVGAVTLGAAGDDVVAQVRPWPYRLDRFAPQPAGKRALFHARDLYNPSTRRVLTRALRTFRPDVVHSHSVQGLSSVALTVPARLGVAHVHTIHDYWLLCQRASMVGRDGRACEELCRPCAAISRLRSELVSRHGPHVVTVVSRAAGREHERLTWVAGRLRVLHNPVETAGVDAAFRTGGGGALTFGYLGRLAPYKGVATLLDAFGRAGLDRARLRIAGDGPLADLVRAAGPSVEYVGWVDGAEKEAFFSSLDCLVVPSEWKDPAPLVVDEAQARGIPVIGARIGGIPELVRAECEPLLYRSGDAGGLRDRLRALAAEPDRFRPGPAPAERSWDAHLDRVLEAYAEARARARR
jgi:glycosyltransferase involved in cell wall biosynthesis